MGASDVVIVVVPQAPVKVGVPGGGTPVGLQPRSLPGGQLVMTKSGGKATVKLAVQVTGAVGEQLLPVSSKVTRLVPPQTGGAPASKETVPLSQAGSISTEATQSLNAAFTPSSVWQAETVRSAGQVRIICK